jgi:hypothetical protein
MCHIQISKSQLNKNRNESLLNNSNDNNEAYFEFYLVYDLWLIYKRII